MTDARAVGLDARFVLPAQYDGEQPAHRGGGAAIGVEYRASGVPYFALWPGPNGPNIGGGSAYSYNTTPNPVREDFGIVRVDRTFSDKDSFNAAYTIDYGNNVGTGQNP